MSSTSRIGIQSYVGIKKLNFDFKIAREERLLQLNELEELRNEAYDNARIYKDKTRNGMIKVL